MTLIAPNIITIANPTIVASVAAVAGVAAVAAVRTVTGVARMTRVMSMACCNISSIPTNAKIVSMCCSDFRQNIKY